MHNDEHSKSKLLWLPSSGYRCTKTMVMCTVQEDCNNIKHLIEYKESNIFAGRAHLRVLNPPLYFVILKTITLVQ